MLGSNHRDKKTPVSRSTTKLHSAISPSMNDQWSGKPLRSCFLESVARPTRSSSQLIGLPPDFFLPGRAWVDVVLDPVDCVVLMKSTPFPVAGPDRFGEA